MPSKEILDLLADESFLNYCFQRDEADVQRWQILLAGQPARQLVASQAKELALLLGVEARKTETDSQYQVLQARLATRAQPAPLWLRSRVTRRLTTWSITTLLIIGGATGVYLYNSRQPPTTDYAKEHQSDIKPGGYSAVLTLANGQRIDLSQAPQGTLAAQYGLKIMKTAAGQLLYQSTTALPPSSNRQLLNTVETPAKGQFSIVLPDGTHVWINAQSALSYPTAFSGHTRLVKLKGEAYFEVAHQLIAGTTRRQPFVVETEFAASDHRCQRIEVLGTHFNVAGYDNEPQATITLLEGSVRVLMPAAGTSATKVLRPGQQLSTGPLGVQVGPADTEAVMAWKNGDFVFHEDLQTALRKVARWYDVEVVYDASAPTQLQLGGWISRQKNISEVLRLLEGTGKVHFKLAGRRVLVSK